MEDITGIAYAILQAVKGGNYILVAALALVFAVGAIKRWPWLNEKIPWINSEAGGVVLVFLASFGGALATTAAAWTAPSWGLIWAAFLVAFAASGGYASLKKLIVPIMLMIGTKIPFLNGVMTWTSKLITDGIGTSPITKAEAAGKLAVKEKPATGIGGIIGEPRDVP